MLFEYFYAHPMRRDLVVGVWASQIKGLRHCASLLMCCALLAGSDACVAVVATSQEAQTSGHEGVQQDYQKMTPTQRSAATRAFLGLGPMPDKVAATRGAPQFVENCSICHGKAARG